MYDNDKKLTTIVGVLYTVSYIAIWLVSGYIFGAGLV